MWYVLYEGHVCSKSCMGDRFTIPHKKCTTYMSHKQNIPHTCPSYKTYHIHVPHTKHTTYTSLIQNSTHTFLIQNSFKFAKEIADQDPGLFRASLDVQSLFTNIPLEETINFCCNSLFSNDAKVNNINRIDFEKLSRAVLQNNFFNFDNFFNNFFNYQFQNIYKQVDGVAMGSPLGPTLANAFLYFHEQIWLNECPDEFKPVYYRRYVDDIFVLFHSSDHLEKFKNYLNSEHRNIRFSSEKEHNNSMPVLDVLIVRTSNFQKTSVYHKPTFSGVYSNFNSFISEEYKVGLIFTLLL